MAYESNAGAIGVGKTYGERGLGGVDGEVRTAGKEAQLTFEFSAETVDDTYIAQILQDYLVTELTLYVRESFGSGATADLSIDGGAGLTTELDLDTTGVSKPDLTGLGNTSGSGPVDVELDLSDTDTQAATAGKASLVVTYERI